jgi:hypothetical protein
MDYEILFIRSLIVTILIETLVLVFVYKRMYKAYHTPLVQLLSAGFLASFATLPYLWFLLPYWIDQQFWYILVGESFAVFAESFILWSMLRSTYLKSLLASFMCNAVSFLIGVILFY